MTDKKVPSPEEIQQEFEDFVKKRFGGQVHVVSNMDDFQETRPAELENETSEQEEFDLTFDLKPKDIKNYLDRYVIKQEEAKKALSIAVCDHYNQVIAHHKNPEQNDEYAKQNVLVLGPTGVGKTYMIKQIAKLVGVPFVKADATRFSETGYMGANVEDLVRDLVTKADGNIELAQYGIIYLDEADKLATPKTMGGRDVNGRGVQLALLKLMEETEVDLRSGNDPASQMQALMDFQRNGKVEGQVINTRHILFVVSGAFTGLDDIIGKRLNQKTIGFGSETDEVINSDELASKVTTQDLIDYGFEPEFVGRLPIKVSCSHLRSKDLFAILKNSEGSIIHQYMRSFAAYGIKAHFTDDAMREVATLAAKEKTGARALMTTLENALRDFKFELPSSQVFELDITAKVIRSPKEELDTLLNSPINILAKEHLLAIQQVEQQFMEQHGLKIAFDQEAINLISSKAAKRDNSVQDICNTLLTSYDHGLKLISQNNGTQEFVLDKKIVLDPSGLLEEMIKDSYRDQIKH